VSIWLWDADRIENWQKWHRAHKSSPCSGSLQGWLELPPMISLPDVIYF